MEGGQMKEMLRKLQIRFTGIIIIKNSQEIHLQADKGWKFQRHAYSCTMNWQSFYCSTFRDQLDYLMSIQVMVLPLVSYY